MGTTTQKTQAPTAPDTEEEVTGVENIQENKPVLKKKKKKEVVVAKPPPPPVKKAEPVKEQHPAKSKKTSQEVEDKETTDLALKYGRWPVKLNIDLSEDFQAMSQREIDPNELTGDFDEIKGLGSCSPDPETMKEVLEFKDAADMPKLSDTFLSKKFLDVYAYKLKVAPPKTKKMQEQKTGPDNCEDK